LAVHWLVQHTAPVRSKPDSRPRLEGARYNYPTRRLLPTNPAFPARHAHVSTHLPIPLPSLGYHTGL